VPLGPTLDTIWAFMVEFLASGMLSLCAYRLLALIRSPTQPASPSSPTQASPRDPLRPPLPQASPPFPAGHILQQFDLQICFSLFHHNLTQPTYPPCLRRQTSPPPPHTHPALKADPPHPADHILQQFSHIGRHLLLSNTATTPARGGEGGERSRSSSMMLSKPLPWWVI
jgi:hypothetical protein